MNIVIYGMGSGGRYVFDEIQNTSHSKVSVLGWIDNYAEVSSFSGLPVMKEDEFYQWEKKPDAVVVTILNQRSAQDAVVSLLGHGYKSVYIVNRMNLIAKLPVLDETGEFSVHMKNWKQVEPIFPRVQYPVVDQCNLNCRGCSSYANIAKPAFVTCEEFEQDMKAMKEKIKKIELFVFYGGEPLLHPDLGSLIRIFRDIYPITPVEIISNGLLIPQISESLAEVIRESGGIVLDITQYPPTRKMLSKIVTFLDENALDYKIGEPLEEFFRILVREEQDAEAVYRRCKDTFYCKTVRKGRLYPCPTIPFTFERLDFFDIQLNESEKEESYFDLYHGIENVWDILVRLRDPFALCKFCQVDQDRHLWRVGKAERSDWIRER
jgi:Molybdenum cofactor biosynthesis enzyme